MSDPLLTPFQIGNLSLKNRIVSTPHAPALAEDGMPKERYQRYHLEKAKGGIAMTMIGGSSCVSPDSPSVFGQLDVSSDRIIPYFTEFAERIHKEDCRIVCQISHLGRRTTWNDGDWLPVIAPSRVREPAHRGFPKIMDHADIKRVIGDYVAAALRQPYLQPCLNPGPRSKFQQSRSSNLCSGLLMLLTNQLWVLFDGVGAMVGRSAALKPFYKLAEGFF